jgi:Zn-finger nucleic acid-binding protein
MKKDCPRCFSELIPEKLSKGLWKVEIDKCKLCSGVFLDKGELMTLTGNRPLHHLTTKYLGIDSGSELLCPKCGSLMDDEHPGGIEIDVCLQCNGVWLDKKELDLLKEIDSSSMKELSPDKLAELYDANQSVSSGGLFSWLFGK